MKKYIIHPFLFGIYPILFLLSHNIHETPINLAALPCLLSLVTSMVSYVILGFFVKNKHKVGFLITIAWILFFSYGHIQDYTQIRDYILLSLWSIIFILIYFSIIKSQSKFWNNSEFLNIMGLVLILMSVFNICYFKFQEKPSSKNSLEIEGNILSDTGTGGNDKDNYSPDIYYIIYDAYTRNDILASVHNHDNRYFTDFLKNKGFYIADKSNSNYMLTFLSLASSLNMEYVNYLSKDVGETAKDRTLPQQMILNNKVAQSLKSKGYTFINVSSGMWYPTNKMSTADVQYEFETVLSEFSKVLLETTALSPIIKKIISSDSERRNVAYSFSKIAEIPAIKAPTFTISHLVCPHPPYLFGKNGETVNKNFSLVDWDKETISAYVNQLIYLNKKIEQLITEILEKSNQPPIIIIQGDHGTAHTSGENWAVSNSAFVKERAGILNAYYLPSIKESILYKNISPVNSFRVIFNQYFNSNLELLEDISYFSNYEQPYRFINVTETVNTRKKQNIEHLPNKQ